MLQDLAALAPPLIVCVAFLVGVGVLVRRELAPRRQRASSCDARADGAGPESGACRAAGDSAAASGSVAGHGMPDGAESTPDRVDGWQT
jgi:hypothetical protein